MCLITFAYRSHPEYSLILLANRDEFFQRPTESMQPWQEQPEILAGRDLQEGGTWLGLTQNGKFTAVTNYRDGLANNNGQHSRGRLTLDFLQAEERAISYARRVKAQQSQFNGFNLLIGDPESGLHYFSNKQGLPLPLAPGIYGLSNALLNTPWPKLQQVRKALTHAISHSELSPEKLIAIMQNAETYKDSELPDTGVPLEWERLLSAAFIQTPEYGTRATTLILQKPNGETQIIEQSYDQTGFTTQQQFCWQLEGAL